MAFAGLAVQLASPAAAGAIAVCGLLAPQLLDAGWNTRIQPEIYTVFERNRPAREEGRKKTAYDNAFVQLVNLGLDGYLIDTCTRT